MICGNHQTRPTSLLTFIEARAFLITRRSERSRKYTLSSRHFRSESTCTTTPHVLAPHTSPETRSGVVVAVGRACTLQGRLFPPTGNTHCRQTDLSLPLPLCARAAEQYCPQHGVYMRCQAASLSEDSKILCKCKHQTRDFRSSGRILCVYVNMCVREFRM